MKILFFCLLSGMVLHAEDWTLTDGEVFRDVTVLKSDKNIALITSSNVQGTRIIVLKTIVNKQ